MQHNFIKMKIFNWMQSKFNGKQGTKKPNSNSDKYHTQPEPRKEEFSDWPDGLLAIGTFGNSDNDGIKEDSKQNPVQENQNQELTPVEVQELQIELNLLWHKQDGTDDHDPESETSMVVLDKLLNTHPSLECDRTNTSDCKDCCPDQGKNRVVVSRGKDVCCENNTKPKMNKKSLTFLVKKMLACRSGSISPTPSLRDQMLESRIEKILRAILHKKIYPQHPSPTLSTKKFLKNKQKPSMDGEDEIDEKSDKGSKWVKTDSEYIVLEI